MAATANVRVIVPAPSSPELRALKRARVAVRCLPFRLRFYQELQEGALSSNQLAARQDWRTLSCQHLDRGRIEDHLIWLIQIGVLRREVDGQGLTERVRLTPLGRDTIRPWDRAIPAARPLARLWHWVWRHQPRL